MFKLPEGLVRCSPRSLVRWVTLRLTRIWDRRWMPRAWLFPRMPFRQPFHIEVLLGKMLLNLTWLHFKKKMYPCIMLEIVMEEIKHGWLGNPRTNGGLRRKFIETCGNIWEILYKWRYINQRVCVVQHSETCVKHMQHHATIMQLVACVVPLFLFFKFGFLEEKHVFVICSGRRFLFHHGPCFITRG
jgi:hypothetical protein